MGRNLPKKGKETFEGNNWYEEMDGSSSSNEDGYARTVILHGPTWKDVEVKRSKPISYPDWASEGPHVVRYTCKGIKVEFPYVDELDNQNVKKYSRPQIVVAAPFNDAIISDNLANPKYLTERTSVTLDVLGSIKKEFNIRDEFELLLPSPNQGVSEVPQGYVAASIHQLRAGLRFPLHPLYRDILRFWQIQLGQLHPNAIRTIVGFILICKSCAVPVNLELFRYFFLISQRYGGIETRGYFYFQKRTSSKRCPILLTQTSVHNWKSKFFFIKHGSFEKWGLLYPWNEAKMLNNAFNVNGIEGEAQNVSCGFGPLKTNFPTEGVWPKGLLRVAGLEKGYRTSMVALRKDLYNFKNFIIYFS